MQLNWRSFSKLDAADERYRRSAEIGAEKAPDRLAATRPLPVLRYQTAAVNFISTLRSGLASSEIMHMREGR